MFEISIDTKLKVDVGGAMQKLKLKNKSVIDQIVNKTIQEVRKESPVREGVFRASVKRLDERGHDGADGSSERFIRIGPSIYYAKFVLNKTRASDGRYVPALDVRINTGQHPGTKANPVIVRAKKRLQQPIKAILMQEYGNIEIGKFIR